MVKIIFLFLSVLFFGWIVRMWWAISKWVFLTMILLFILTILKGV